ncbi:MAG: hypothetical protein AAF358_00275 [Pseudomonadota bacterium]
MIDVFRIMGFLLILSGMLVIVTWMIEPLRALWPLFLALPTPVLIGVTVAVLGLMLLMASLIWERTRDKREEENMLEQD